MTKALVAIPVRHPYRQGSMRPTEAMVTSPENLCARVSQAMTPETNPTASRRE